MKDEVDEDALKSMLRSEGKILDDWMIPIMIFADLYYFAAVRQADVQFL
jgi:hypothetical protein